MDFDFDRWCELARTAPDEFERQRRATLEQLIEDCNGTHRLKGLQCRIDMERIRTRTPMKSCLRLSTLMWDRFLDFNNALNHWRASGDASPDREKAEVIPFPRG